MKGDDGIWKVKKIDAVSLYAVGNVGVMSSLDLSSKE